jgi:sulfate permease, SulP family
MIAGVNPALALQATWLMNLITSLIGGRPGMISGTTSFVGIALADLVLKEGVEYVYYAIMFAGLLQVAFGVLGLSALMRFVPHSVVQGFCNAISVYTVLAQLRFGKINPDEVGNGRRLVEFGHSWNHIANDGSTWINGSSLLLFGIHVLTAFLICISFPKITRAVPGSFVAMLFCLIMNQFFDMLPSKYLSPTVSDFATIKTPTFLPVWNDETVVMPSFSVDTFFKVYLYGLAVFGTGLSESMLASHIVDDLTEIKGAKGRVAIGQGIANIINAIFGGMGGSGSMAQTIVANHSDGITGLCTFLTSMFQLLFFYAAYDFVNIIPLGAISGIMIWGAFKLFDFESILQALSTVLPLRVRNRINLDCKTPRVDALIMLAVMGITLCLDLSIGLLSGVFIATFAFVWDSSNRLVVRREFNSKGSNNVIYSVSGPLFFATAGGFCSKFSTEKLEKDPDEVVIFFDDAEIYDHSGMVALKNVHDRFIDAGKFVAISSISPKSKRLMEKTAYMWQGVNFLEVDDV